jgi:hypothetical protein
VWACELRHCVVWYVGASVADESTAYTLRVKGKFLLLSSDLYMNAGQYIKMYHLHPLHLAQFVFYNDWPLGPILRL